MQKVNSKSIYIVLFFIGIIQGHAKAHENDSILFLNQDLKQIFDSFQSNRTDPVIFTLFYTMDNVTYLMLQEIPQHDPFISKGYFTYKNFILSYYEINKDINKNYINLSLLHSNDTTAYKEIICDWDVPPRFFEIDKNGGFIEFKPNKIHNDKLLQILINMKIFLLPPPPPK